MARKNRIQEIGFYHVINRGVARKLLVKLLNNSEIAGSEIYFSEIYF